MFPRLGIAADITGRFFQTDANLYVMQMGNLMGSKAENSCSDQIFHVWANKPISITCVAGSSFEPIEKGVFSTPGTYMGCGSNIQKID